MTSNSSGDVPLRVQKAVRLLPFAVLVFGIWASYDQWWRGTYVPQNTIIWTCRLKDRSVVDHPRYYYASAEYGICGASVSELEANKESVYLVAYSDNEFAASWKPTWLETPDPRTSAFEATLAVPAYLPDGSYRVEVRYGKVLLDEVEITLLARKPQE